MTERINFLSRSKYALNYLKMGKISGAFLLVFLMVITLQNFRYSRTEGQLKQIKNQIQQHKAKREKGFMGGAKGELSPFYIITNAMLREPAWPETLFAISNSLASGIWLEKIKGEILEEGNEVIIEGTANQSDLVPRFLERLRRFETFSRIQLMSTKISENGQGECHFQIKGILKGS